MAKKIRFIIPIIILIVVIIIFVTRKDALNSFLSALATANWAWIVVAILALAARYFMYGWAFIAGFKAIGAKINFKKMTELVFSVTFLNDAAPTAGLAGTAYMAGWAVKKGSTVGAAVSLAFIDKITFFGSFSIIQTAGLILLAVNGQLTFLLLAGACVIYFLAAVFIVALIISHKAPDKLAWILRLFVKLKNRLKFIFKKETSMEWADKTADSIKQASSTIIHNPTNVIHMFIRMFLLFVFEFASFMFVCLSFGYFSVTGVVAGYVCSFISSMLILQTVGIVEAILVAMLVSFGCDFGVATAITLAYRGLLFWAPFGIGAICTNHTSKDFLSSLDSTDTSATTTSTTDEPSKDQSGISKSIEDGPNTQNADSINIKESFTKDEALTEDKMAPKSKVMDSIESSNSKAAIENY